MNAGIYAYDVTQLRSLDARRITKYFGHWSGLLLSESDTGTSKAGKDFTAGCAKASPSIRLRMGRRHRLADYRLDGPAQSGGPHEICF